MANGMRKETYDLIDANLDSLDLNLEAGYKFERSELF